MKKDSRSLRLISQAEESSFGEREQQEKIEGGKEGPSHYVLTLATPKEEAKKEESQPTGSKRIPEKDLKQKDV